MRKGGKEVEKREGEISEGEKGNEPMSEAERERE